MKTPARMLFVVLCLMSLLSAPAEAQRNLKDIPVPDPELERATFVLPEGFEVNLFAADPRIAKPIHINFDPQGRLWIASSEVYPQIKPGEAERDRILIVEDTTGDGVADKTSVFADGLLIPTGVAPGDGGAYVANSTQLLHFKDTDGDGRADKKRIVLSGFGTEDTHHILHTLRWAPTGHLYMNQSIYIHSHIETPHGVRRLNAGGIWRFRPESLELNVFMRGLVNSWGHAIDRWGQSFATDGAGGEGINYIVPGGYYFTAANARRIVHGLNPGSPKHCGLEFIDGRQLPDEFQGNLITHDFRGHRVCRFVLTENGAGYSSRQETELIKSDHVAFRPVDVKQGPDGAIYIADWYNPIIQHGEVDFRDPRRDHTHGRIWRVTYTGNPVLKKPLIANASSKDLVAHLASPESWTRQMAHQVIRERGQEIVPAILNWVKEIKGTDANADQLRLEGFWALQSVHAPGGELLNQLLQSGDGRIRAAAVRGLILEKQRFPKLLPQLATLIHDVHPRVRLETIRALSELSRAALDGQTPIEIATHALEQPMDEFLDYSLWLMARETQDEWMPLLRDGNLSLTQRPQHLVFALKAVGTADAARSVLDLLVRNPQTDVAALSSIVASVGSAGDLGQLLKLGIDSKDPNARRAVIQSLAAARRKVAPANSTEQLIPLISSDDDALAAAAIECAGRWKLNSAEDAILQIATSDTATDGKRSAAIRALGGLNRPQSKAALKQLAVSDQQPVRVAAIRSLADVAPNEAAKLSVAAFQKGTGENAKTDSAEILFDVLLQRKNGSKLLATALKDQQIPEEIARIGLQRVSASGRPAAELESALFAAGSISNKPQKLTAEEMQQFLVDVQATGNASRGEVIYRRAELQCTKCHAIGGAGGRVGPDLISLGASAPVDYIITSLLVPNDKVKENYNTLVIETKNGRVHTGIPVRKSDTHIVLRDVNDKETQIAKATIEEQTNGSSIMPSGLTQRLPRQDLVDLTRFLSELGKGSYAVGKTQVARRWQVLRNTQEAANRLRRTSYDQPAKSDPAFQWDPAYSTVAGELPLTDLPDIVVRGRREARMRGARFARCEINVTQPGTAKLLLNDTAGINGFLGEKPLDLQADEIELPRGRHWITFSINAAERKTSLRLQLELVSPATRAEFVNGK